MLKITGSCASRRTPRARRCTRPKLAVLSDLALRRRRNPATAPTLFCPLDEIGEEALRALEGWVRLGWGGAGWGGVGWV